MENTADVRDLFRLAARLRPTRKLVVMGGLHGYDPTGIPTAQRPAEKVVAPGAVLHQTQNVVNVAGRQICTFATSDLNMKSTGTGVDFIYKNIAKYAPANFDVPVHKQAEVIKLIKGYAVHHVILLSWCFSQVWAVANGL